MIKTDVLVIGGSATGLVAAMTAKANNPDKDVTVVRKEEKVMIPCGIPYVYGSTGSTDNNILPDGGLNKLGVNILVNEVTKISPEKKSCELVDGQNISYEKLIIGTGSLPIIPDWLSGTSLNNVFTVPKDKNYLDKLQKDIEGLKKVVVVGAGFIGVEISDELNKSGNEVYLIEKLPYVLASTFDEEFASDAQEKLLARGVNVVSNVGIKSIYGKDRVEGILLDNGEKIEADAVILSLGYQPNVSLAKDMGLEINKFGFIKVDQYRRTSLNDIFAAGDCSEKIDFATGELSKVMLASTACTEARVAALNLYGLDTYTSFKGTIGIYSTCIGDTAYGVAGLIEKDAIKQGYKILTSTFTGVNRHPGKISDSHPETVKLIVSKESGVILGGEVMGGKCAGQLINVIGLAIQNAMTAHDLILAQIGTQPLLTASPAGFPLIKAAESVVMKLKNN